MIVTLKTQGLQTLEHIRAFLDGTEAIDYKIDSRREAYDFVTETLRRFRYERLGKTERGLVKAYLGKVTGLSRAQVTRLVRPFVETRQLRDRRGPPAKSFRRVYTAEDVRLLAEVDALHGQLSGPATRKLCERAFLVFGEVRYERLAKISNGHLYNLRHSKGYQRHRALTDRTRPSPVAIGERRKPRPEGQPGYRRVDSVPQGDQDGIKGLYLINLVDEVTQFQFVGAVERIGERWGHSGSRERGARRSGAIGKRMGVVALALTRPVAEPPAKVIQLPLPGLGPGGAKPPKPPPRPRFLKRKRRSCQEVNEPVRPRLRRTSMSRWELYEWHERMGTLPLYFLMFPEP